MDCEGPGGTRGSTGRGGPEARHNLHTLSTEQPLPPAHCSTAVGAVLASADLCMLRGCGLESFLWSLPVPSTISGLVRCCITVTINQYCNFVARLFLLVLLQAGLLQTATRLNRPPACSTGFSRSGEEWVGRRTCILGEICFPRPPNVESSQVTLLNPVWSPWLAVYPGAPHVQSVITRIRSPDRPFCK